MHAFCRAVWGVQSSFVCMFESAHMQENTFKEHAGRLTCAFLLLGTFSSFTHNSSFYLFTRINSHTPHFTTFSLVQTPLHTRPRTQIYTLPLPFPSLASNPCSCCSYSHWCPLQTKPHLCVHTVCVRVWERNRKGYILNEEGRTERARVRCEWEDGEVEEKSPPVFPLRKPPSSPSPRPIVFSLHLLPPSVHLHILGALHSDIANPSAASGYFVNVKWRAGNVQIIAKYITGVLHLWKKAAVWTELISVML